MRLDSQSWCQPILTVSMRAVCLGEGSCRATNFFSSFENSSWVALAEVRVRANGVKRTTSILGTNTREAHVRSSCPPSSRKLTLDSQAWKRINAQKFANLLHHCYVPRTYAQMTGCACMRGRMCAIESTAQNPHPPSHEVRS